jgi:hypothetical protein
MIASTAEVPTESPALISNSSVNISRTRSRRHSAQAFEVTFDEHEGRIQRFDGGDRLHVEWTPGADLQ